MADAVRILVLFDSRGGLTEQLAEAVAAGIREVPGAEAMYHRIHESTPQVLLETDAVIIGSPNWSGMTGKLKDWFDYSGDLWQTGELAGKPGAAFAAGYSRSAGIEATLLQLVHLLLSHGMLVVGLPWTDAMRTSGSYYGATAHGSVTEEDRAQARALGRRVAEVALRLRRGEAAPGVR
ncbi:MAG TPA: NAD(P)H-dependent oxidoreductase [Dehalococcoidia bacterium]|nr:NAD(P)H-dependent oxidoreductase [Dehalococcoidia bacterium]